MKSPKDDRLLVCDQCKGTGLITVEQWEQGIKLDWPAQCPKCGGKRFIPAPASDEASSNEARGGAEGMKTMEKKQRFILDYERQPDSGWSMTLHGEVEATTLGEALSQTSDSLGARLWKVVSSNDMHGWDIAIVRENGEQDSITGCWDCYAEGCEYCDYRGYLIEGGEEEGDKEIAETPAATEP